MAQDPPATTLTDWLAGSSDGWKKTYRYKSSRKKKPNLQTTIEQTTTTTLLQTDLSGQPLAHKTGQAFGHQQPPSESSTFRIVSQNIHNIPAKSYTEKSHRITAQATGGDSADIRLWQEIGLFWPNLRKTDNWYARTQGKRDRLCSQWAYNVHDPPSLDPYQAGGTAAITSKRLTPRINTRGSDATGLGRWAWIRVGTAPLRCTTFLSVYRPCKPSSTGLSTVYAQHRRQMHKTDADPRAILLADLRIFIIQQQSLGDIIIVGIDANEDVRGRTIKPFFAELQMHDAILSLHSTNCPSTNLMNESSEPIDAIFCSRSILPIRAGFLSSKEGCPSDHVQLWADFAKADIIGGPTDDLHFHVDPLNAADPRLTEAYNRQSYSQLQDIKLLQKLEILDAIEPDFFHPEHEQQFNKLLTANTETRLKVKSKLRHVFTGKQDWSPEWAQSQLVKRTWLQVLRYRLLQQGTLLGRKGRPRQKVSLTQIRRLMRAAELPKALTLTIPEIESKLAEAKQLHKENAQNCSQLRWTHVGKLDEARAQFRDTTVESERKQRKQTQRQREQGRALARLKKKTRQPVTKVTAIIDGTVTECSTKHDIEQACITENDGRFRQTEDTPPMARYLTNQIGFSAEKPGAEEVLAGTFDYSCIDHAGMRKVLEYLRKPVCVLKEGPIDSTLSVADHIQGWKKQKERTASVRSDLSFSDHKAATQHPGMAKIDTLFRRIPYKHGFSPARYQQITDFQILKKSGIYAVALMRTIQLMVAAFNMNNKKTGNDTIRRAERLKLIPKDQAGSRKHRRSVISALEKVLCNDILRQRRLAAAIVSNDAKSCYDRIVLWIAALALLRLGLGKGPVQEMMTTLQQAVHRINTAYGDSSSTYGGSNDPPHQGVGQGNGAGPTIWAVISAILLTIMQDLGFGLNTLSALSDTALTLVGFAFVDDTDLFNAASSVLTKGEDHLAHSQQCVDWWEAILRATGGGLRVDKSFWIFVDFRFRQGAWKYRSTQQLPGQLLATHHDGQRMALKRIEPSQGEITLGVAIAMDGNQRDEKLYLADKAGEYADQLRAGLIRKQDAWYSFKTSFLKTLEYPMEAVSLSLEDWDEVVQPVMGILLQKCGFASTFPRKLVWTSLKYQGLGAQHPFYSMLLKHLRVLLEEPLLGSNAGTQLIVTMEDLRREAGWPGHLSDIPPAILGSAALTDCWVKPLLLRLQALGIRLEDPLPKLSIQREGDTFLMEYFLRSPRETTEVRDLLHCCQFLGAHTVADLASADGKSIRPSAWAGNRIDRCYPSATNPRPPPRASLNWRLWQSAVCPLVVSPQNLLLRSPLHLWLQPPHTWKFRYSPSQDRLFFRLGHIWSVLRRTAARPNRRLHQGIFGHIIDADPTLPMDLVRADVSRRRDRFILHSIGAHLQVPLRPAPMDLDSCLPSIPLLDQWALDEIWHTDNGSHVAGAIRQGTALAISDGSYKQDRGTSAFLLQGPLKTEHRILGVNRTPGNPSDQSPYRAELSGISGILSLLSLLCQIHDIKQGSIRIGLDGDSAMKEASGLHPLHADQPSFDLLSDIRRKIVALPITLQFFWVEGHQYERNGFVSYLGTLNDLCDSMAKEHWNDSIPLGILPAQRFHDEQFSITIEGAKVGQLNRAAFYDSSHGKTEAIPYWQARQHLPDEAILNINWTAITHAMAAWPFGKRRWLAKHLAGFSATGRVMRRRKEWTHDRCPRCLAPDEDAFHVVACRDPRARSHYRKAVDTSCATLDSLGTDSDIVLLFKSRLLSWGTPQARNFAYYPLSTTIRKALLAQDSLGWYQALNGRLSTLWQDAQAEWIAQQATRYKRSPTKWAGRASLALVEIPWQMWEHRNLIYHDPAHPWSQERNTDLTQQILQTLGAHTSAKILPRDRSLFSIPPQELTQQSLEDKRKWMDSVTAAYSRFYHHKEAATQRDPQQQSLELFFTRTHA